MTYKNIGILGDSIAAGFWDDANQGWFGRLAEMLSKDTPNGYGFYNLAVDGDRSVDIFHRLNGEALSRDLDVLFIAVGVNDTCRFGDGSVMQVDETLRHETWDKILSVATKNIDKVVVFSVLPVLEEGFPEEGFKNRLLWHKNSDIEAYNEFLKKMCTEYGVTFCDVSPAFPSNDRASYLADSTHPSPKGHQALAEIVYDFVTKNNILAL